MLAYAVRNGNLTLCDYMVNDCSIAANTGNTAIWVPIANNIVSLKAQYGARHHERAGPPQYVHGRHCGLVRSNHAAGSVLDPGECAGDSATLAADVSGGVAGPTYQCAFARISAVRIALVARNANFEKPPSPQSRPRWAGSVAHTPPNPPTVSDSIGWAADPIDLTREYGFDGARDLAELPLQRNPDRGAAAQSRMAGSAERMLSKTQTRPARGSALRAGQAGVVLMMALIVLVAMTLAGIALVRSVDTSNIIAGNLAFKQAATNSGDTGIEAAAAWLNANSGALTNNALARATPLLSNRIWAPTRPGTITGTPCWRARW